ncbi:MAG: hypothetical protein AAGC55_25520, partial [Myxococcota bacterium]
MPRARLAPRGMRARLWRTGDDLRVWSFGQAKLGLRVAARCASPLMAALLIGAIGIGLGMVLGNVSSSPYPHAQWQAPDWEYTQRRMVDIRRQIHVDPNTGQRHK